jgi:hypothetical protein
LNIRASAKADAIGIATLLHAIGDLRSIASEPVAESEGDRDEAVNLRRLSLTETGSRFLFRIVLDKV